MRNGVALLRPLCNGEHGVLDMVFDGLSSASRYDRYLTGVPQLTRSMRSALTDVDGRDHIAWVAEVDGQPAAIGRLIRVGPGEAELALEVVDHLQGLGLGSALLDTLLTVASVSGIDRVRATVLPSNDRSLRLLRRFGMTFLPEGGLLEGTAAVQLPHRPRVDREAVVRLACAGAGAGARSADAA
jgi:GNAT superfamily N-acetyltransferase